MLIAQMTDIHIGFEPEARPEELNRTRFRATLERLQVQPNVPDVLVLTGDITDRGDIESFDKTAELLADLPFPVYPMMGNHDTREGLLHAFPDTPTADGFVQYTIERDDFRVLMLDTYEPGRHGGAFCEVRAAWLADQLAARPATPTLIFMHHPPVVSGIEWMDPGEDEQWIARLGGTLAGHSQVLGLHCGHLHRPLASQFAGIPLGVTGSVAPLVSLDLRPVDPNKPDSRALITTEPPGYALHYWDGVRLATHYERVADWTAIAWFGPHLQPMIRDLVREKGTG